MRLVEEDQKWVDPNIQIVVEHWEGHLVCGGPPDRQRDPRPTPGSPAQGTCAKKRNSHNIQQ